MITVALVATLSHLAVALLARYYGRQEGREEEHRRTAAALAHLERRAAERDRDMAQLLADLDRLKTMQATGRRAGRA